MKMKKEIIRLGVGFSVQLIEYFILGGKIEMMNFYSKEINNIQEKINIARN